jgi:phosphate transport system substrate-binding protein
MHFSRSRFSILACLLVIIALAAAFVACGDDDNATTTPTKALATTAPAASGQTNKPTTAALEACPPGTAATSLTGDGSTFVQPLFSDWFTHYKTQCNVTVNYQGVGSGQGITDLTNKAVDFAASDAIMTDQQKQAAGGEVMHIPMTSDAVAVIYNVEGVANKAITLDGDTLAKIFLGTIAKWNDPAIAALNSGVTLPDQDILVVHRSDGSGTTNIFTNYLDKVNADWHSQVGTKNSVEWPAGVGAQGSSGVAGQVQQQPGSIGYVSFAYAISNNINYAKLKNKSGTAVEPSIDSARAASEGLTLPDNMQIVITDSSAPAAYPISGFSWMLVAKEQTDKAKATTLGRLINWMLTDAQQYSEANNFVPLSDAAVAKAQAELAQITFQGTKITELE